MRLSNTTQLARAIAVTAVHAVRESVTTHAATTDAAPCDVWELLSSPSAWPSFDPRVIRVEGAGPHAGARAHLMAVTRVAGLRVPVDVEDFRVGQSITTTVRIMPGLSEIAEHQIVPVAAGGTKIVSRVRAAGVFGPAAAVPVWVSAEVVVRLLAWRAGRISRSSSPRASAPASAAST